jgi:hypothetical protein
MPNRFHARKSIIQADGIGDNGACAILHTFRFQRSSVKAERRVRYSEGRETIFRVPLCFRRLAFGQQGHLSNTCPEGQFLLAEGTAKIKTD